MMSDRDVFFHIILSNAFLCLTVWWSMNWFFAIVCVSELKFDFAVPCVLHEVALTILQNLNGRPLAASPFT